jgi:hypothetical protein
VENMTKQQSGNEDSRLKMEKSTKGNGKIDERK